MGSVSLSLDKMRLFIASSLTSAVLASNSITASCNADNTISVDIAHDINAKILSADYGSCNLTSAGVRGFDDEDTTSWSGTLSPSLCDMDGKLRNLQYNQTAEFTVGRSAAGKNFIFSTYKVDTYCEYKATYTIDFEYGSISTVTHDFDVSGGIINLQFVVESTNEHFNATETAPSQAGKTIYLTLGLNDTLHEDFDYAEDFSANSGKAFVPMTCFVKDASNNTYTLFDANDDLCSNSIIDLGLNYDTKKHQWQIQHRLFLLGSYVSISLTLSCDITVCDMQKDNSCKSAYSCFFPGYPEEETNPCDDIPGCCASWKIEALNALAQKRESVGTPTFEHFQSIAASLPENWESLYGNGDYQDILTADNSEGERAILSVAYFNSYDDLLLAIVLQEFYNVTEPLETRGYNDRTVLLKAFGSKEKTALLLALGASFDVKDQDNMSVPALVAQSGYVDHLEFLLEGECVPSIDINEIGFDDRTMLHSAVVSDYNATAKVDLLIKHGIDITLKDKERGDTALLRATLGESSVVDHMIDEYIKLNQTDQFTETGWYGLDLLQRCAAYDKPDIIRRLLTDDFKAYGVDQRRRNYEASAQVAVMYAAWDMYGSFEGITGSFEGMKLLIEDDNAVITIKDTDLDNSLWYADARSDGNRAFYNYLVAKFDEYGYARSLSANTNDMKSTGAAKREKYGNFSATD